MSGRGEALYALYAPDASPWSAWAKPVLFATERAWVGNTPGPLAAIDASWAPEAGRGAIVLVDLKGDVSVAAGMALARRGYRPIPLFNGVPGGRAVIDVGPIVEALQAGAEVLAELRLGADAPPAFLLDARRRGRGHRPAPGHFDNRWVVFPQDFPSAAFLASRGIRDVLLWLEAGEAPAEDLLHVLRRWQQAGLRILRHRFDSEGPPEDYTVPRPAAFRAAWYRVLALLGLGRASVGGFGTRIPVPSATGAGIYG